MTSLLLYHHPADCFGFTVDGKVSGRSMRLAASEINFDETDAQLNTHQLDQDFARTFFPSRTLLCNICISTGVKEASADKALFRAGPDDDVKLFCGVQPHVYVMASENYPRRLRVRSIFAQLSPYRRLKKSLVNIETRTIALVSIIYISQAQKRFPVVS